MGAGILQLSARGFEDIFIMSEPEITFFKTVYRRHTNFSRGELDLHFSSRLNFGKTSRCLVQRWGDLLHKLFLVIDLPEINIRFKKFKNKEVKKKLNDCGILWENNNPQNLFGEKEYNEVLQIVLDEIEKVLTKLNFIKNSLEIVENSDYNINEILQKIIMYTQNGFLYKFINAEFKDNIINNQYNSLCDFEQILCQIL